MKDGRKLESEGCVLTFPEVGQSSVQHDWIDAEHLVKSPDGLIDRLVAPQLERPRVNPDETVTERV